MMPYGGGWNWGWGVGGMIVWGILVILFWVAVIAAIVWVIRYIVRHDHRHEQVGGGIGGQSPLDIAKARYARGEITKEQFEQLKKDLM